MSEIKTTRSKVNIFYKNNLKIEEKIITNISNYQYKSEIFTNGKKYLLEIQFQESRYKHQCWLTVNDKKSSLSFFDSQKIAKQQALETICYLNGIKGENQNNQIVGD